MNGVSTFAGRTREMLTGEAVALDLCGTDSVYACTAALTR